MHVHANRYILSSMSKFEGLWKHSNHPSCTKGIKVFKMLKMDRRRRRSFHSGTPASSSTRGIHGRPWRWRPVSPTLCCFDFLLCVAGLKPGQSCLGDKGTLCTVGTVCTPDGVCSELSVWLLLNLSTVKHLGTIAVRVHSAQCAFLKRLQWA